MVPGTQSRQIVETGQQLRPSPCMVGGGKEMTTKTKHQQSTNKSPMYFEDPFVWYEEPLLAEPEKTRHFSTREL